MENLMLFNQDGKMFGKKILFVSFFLLGLLLMASVSASDINDMAQNLKGFLGRMLRRFKPFISHADGTLEKVMHLILFREVPGMSLIPHTDN